MGGSGTIDELVAAVDRGLLITRSLNVGSTHRPPYGGGPGDGTFLIERGRLVGAVNGLRFNGNPISMLNNVDAIGTVERLLASESGTVGFPIAAPALTINDVPFISLSNAF